VAFDDAGDYSRAAKRLPSITTAAFRMVLASGSMNPTVHAARQKVRWRRHEFRDISPVP
jgi:hypothetical protein